MVMMLGVVMVRKLVMGGRLGILWSSWVGPLRRLASRTYRKEYMLRTQQDCKQSPLRCG